MARFKKKAGLAAVFALAAGLALTGCTHAAQLGGGATTLDLKGEFSNAQVFKGGRESAEVVTIPASVLKAGASYAYDAPGEGALVIEGDIPKGVSLTVKDGKLTVNGDVGAGAKLDVEEPVVTHDRTVGCTQYGCTHETVVDGLLYNDPSPAIIVTGKADPSVSVVSNGGIVINGKNIPNSKQIPAAPGR